MQRIIVTGKSGNLSVAVYDYLKNSGYDVCSIGLRDSKWEHFDFSGCDVIVHIAGIVPKDGVESEDFYKINYELTEKLAKKAKSDGVKHFVYISSMAVYGIAPILKKGKGVVSEDTPCIPSGDYGKSKLLAESALEKIKDESFRVAIIRVPSIYGEGKTEYLEQYKYSFGRLRFLPYIFTDRYKSIICVENLCELIRLIAENKSEGVFCPDDGTISAFDIARAVMPYKKTSKLLGILIGLLSFSDRTKDYYGSVCYSEKLTDIFGGDYRIRNYKEVIKNIYEK